MRPIALLETFHKCTTKVLTKHFSKIISEKTILQGPNFAGLPGNSTEEPIQILNAVIEEAKEQNKELWILFQDMKKAYNSVNLEILQKVFERIKVLLIICSF